MHYLSLSAAGLTATRRLNEITLPRIWVFGDPTVFATGSPIFSDSAADWGSFGEVMWYMGGMDHGTPGHFAGLGEQGGIDGRLGTAKDWLVKHHPELKVAERSIKEGPLPADKMGSTDPRTKEITIDPEHIDTMDMYVESLAHELMHANDSVWTNLMSGYYEFFFYPALSSRHQEIFRDSRIIGREYAHEHGE